MENQAAIKELAYLYDKVNDIRSKVAIDAGIIALEQTKRHCKNCIHFEKESWAECDGVPIIVAHNICKKWGRGCVTREDGYCFMYED